MHKNAPTLFSRDFSHQTTSASSVAAPTQTGIARRSHDKRAKGQISIEFIIIVTVSLLYLLVVVFPNAEKTRLATEDTTRAILARQAVDELATAVYRADSNPGPLRQTIRIVVPEKTVIGCLSADQNLFTQIELAPGLPVPTGCQNTDPPLCKYQTTFSGKISSAQPLDCQPPSSAFIPARANRHQKSVTIEKNAIGTISLRVTDT